MHCCKTEHYYPSTPLPGRGMSAWKLVREGIGYSNKNQKPGQLRARAIDSDTNAFQPLT